MNLRQITLISALLLFILIFSCEEPAKEELDIPDTPSSLIYNFSGNWSLIAWIPIDCPGCYDYHYYISGGGLRFNSLYYDLKISYLFRNLPDSIIEHGTYIHSSEYFISWESASTMFTGEILFTPDQGDPWTVKYQVEDPDIQPNVVIFKNFILKNDTTGMMFYWTPEV